MRSGRSGKTVVMIAIGWGLAVAVVAMVGWAWIDGGREPLHEISESVAVPEPTR